MVAGGVTVAWPSLQKSSATTDQLRARMQPISVVLDTFATRQSTAEPFARAFDRVRRTLVEPLLAADGGGLRAWFELAPGFVLGRPTLPAEDGAWEQVAEVVAGGAVEYCSIEVRGDSRAAGYFHFGIRPAHELVADVPHTVTMHAHPTLFAAVSGVQLTDEVTALARGLAVGSRASTGYVACHLALSKEAEEQRGGDVSYEAEPDLRIHLRGCYWGNFLSAGHLAVLGGRTQVLETCPADVVDDLTEDDHELVFAGLHGDPCDDQGHALIELERFLEPVLPRHAQEPVAVGLDTLD
jgi:hypothetical protein